MNGNFDPIATLRLTLTAPRQGARAVLNLGLTQGERLGLLALVAILNVLAVEAFVAVAPEPPEAMLASFLDRPLAFAGMQIGGILLMTGLVHGVGRLFGGRGQGAGALVVVIWLQVILLLLQLAQVLAMLVLPPLTVLIGLASLGALFWLLPNFVAELHGFQSVGLTFVGMIGTVVVVSLLLGLALATILSAGA